MCFKFAALALISIASLAYGLEVAKDKRQVNALVTQKEDHQAAESFGAPAALHHHGGKYYQYTHVPAKDHYEHGHKRGNDHHFIERHEKAHPHHGEFKTKVRWGDKHGGYGEHYWDYNHAGHHDDHGEESQKNEEYAAYEETQAVPQYTAEQLRGKRQPSEDVEFINEGIKSLVLSGATGKHGGNYKQIDEFERGKRANKKFNGEDLAYEPKTGYVVDERTGRAYELKPVDY